MRYQFLAVLETHGTSKLINQNFRPLVGRTHKVFHSAVEDSGGSKKTDSGGIALFVPLNVLDAFHVATTPLKELVQVLVPGRALRLGLDGGGGRPLSAFFVHNFGISLQQMIAIQDSIKQDIADERCVVLVGDFNLYASGERRIMVPKPECGALYSSSDAGEHSIRPFQARWQRIFDSLVELKSPLPTRFASHDSSLVRIDRGFTNCARSGIPLMCHNIGVIKDPLFWHVQGMSDHAPWFWEVTPRRVKQEGNLTLKKEWLAHPSFKVRFDEIVQEAELGQCPLAERNILIKGYIRTCALHARDVLFVDEPNSINNILLRLGSISRAVWLGDKRLAEILLSYSDLARDHLEINEVGLPTLKHQKAFEEQFRAAKEKGFVDLKGDILREAGAGPNRKSDFQNAKKNSRLQACERQAALWYPRSPKLSVLGIRLSASEALDFDVEGNVDEQGRILSTNCDHIAEAFGNVWGRIFTEKPTDQTLAEQILTPYAEQKYWDWTLANPPCMDMIRGIRFKSKNSAPGGDGIPYFAWDILDEFGSRHISDLLDSHLKGNTISDSFNEGEFVFPDKLGPETEEERTEGSIFRHPEETRPLTLKNTDNKKVALVLNFSVSPVIERCACDLQNGFIHGRQLVQNPVDLDHSARLSSLRYASKHDEPRNFAADITIPLKGCLGLLPLLLLFDYAAAFPSVAHWWIFAVLKFAGAPTGFINAVKTLYTDNKGYYTVGGLRNFLFMVTSGVLQGCPLSGSLFVFAIDPLLRHFKTYIDSKGVGKVRACADDLGMVAALKYLSRIKGSFDKYQKVSGLTLKPAKCIMILLNVEATEFNVGIVREWIAQNCPGWENFKITNTGKYLGFFWDPERTRVNGTRLWPSLRSGVPIFGEHISPRLWP